MINRPLAISLLAFLFPTLANAQSFVEHMAPPVLERGKTTRVTFVGNKLAKGVDLWTTLAPITIKSTSVESTPTVVTFDVTVAADAPVGVFGLRLATVDGLSNAFFGLVDDLPVQAVPEKEHALTKLRLPAAVWGRFREAMVDRFAIEVTAGQRVSFEAVGNRFGKDVDPLITILDAKGRFVAERDNEPGLYFDCRFEHQFADAGTYFVEVRDSRFHGSEHGFYVLRVGNFPAATVAVPCAVNPGRTKLHLPELGDAAVAFETPATAAGIFYATLKRLGDHGSSWLPLELTDREIAVFQGTANVIDQATPAPVPGIACGVLAKPGDRHFFKLELTKGQRIQVRAEARLFNSPADLELAIIDGKGKEVRRVTENVQKEEVLLDFNAGAPGPYTLAVRDLNRDGGPSFAYRLDIRNTQPEVQVSADVEGFTVPRGTYQPVPLTITRTDYKGKIELTLVGAPEGVKLTPSEIAADATAVVCQLSADANASLGVHTLQIMARAAELPDAPATAVTCRPLIDKQMVNVDLIPYGLREDQRRLPPTLTNRFALQVTPPPPFTVQLRDELVTLGRYQHAEFPIIITRDKNFTGTVTFGAKGGQIAPKEEGRTRVYAEFPIAMAGQPQVMGSIHSKILTNLAKHRVDVTAVGTHNDRQVTLTRSFNLEIRSAFAVSFDPPAVKLESGNAAKVRLNVDRMKTFKGAVTAEFSPAAGVELPNTVVIPADQSGVDVEVKIAADRPAGRFNINLSATAEVNGYEEENRGVRLDVEVLKIPTPKK